MKKLVPVSSQNVYPPTCATPPRSNPTGEPARLSGLHIGGSNIERRHV
jgi:hypothetical protein